MQDDHIIKEVRRVRRQIEAECGNDSKKYVAHLLKVQKAYKAGPVVRGAPKPLRRPKAG